MFYYLLYIKLLKFFLIKFIESKKMNFQFKFILNIFKILNFFLKLNLNLHL